MTSDHMVFVENSCEVGNSGTLMYLLHPSRKSELIGIYMGTQPPLVKGADLKRGKICPLPKRLQDKFMRHDPTPDLDAPCIIRIETRPRRFRRRIRNFEKVATTHGNPFYRSVHNGDLDECGILVGVNGTPIPDEGGLS